MKDKRIVTIPNLLSLIRLLLIPLFVWLYAMTNIAKLKRLRTRKMITALEDEQNKEGNLTSGSQ